MTGLAFLPDDSAVLSVSGDRLCVATKLPDLDAALSGRLSQRLLLVAALLALLAVLLGQVLSEEQRNDVRASVRGLGIPLP